MNSLQRSFKKSKKLFTAIFVILIIFIMAVPRFAGAYTSVDTWSLQSMYVVEASSAVSYSYNSAGEFTTVTNTSSSSFNTQVLYKLNNEKWIAGQTYQIVFNIYRVSSNVGLALALSSVPNLTSGEQLYITNDTVLSVDTYSFSFTYTGQPYFCVSLILPPSSSVRFGNFQLNSYNPNAELESQNQEIIEQNSELNSKLFDDGETYSFPEVDLSEQYSLFDEHKNDLLENGGLITQQNRLVNGVKAFATMFTSVYSLFTEFEVTQFIPFLMYLSVICSLILLILGFVKSRGDK